MEFFPEDYRYPSTDYERMAHILTAELIAEDKRSQKSDAPFEVAKLLTTELFAKGKAIQCYFGEKEDVLSNRQVECIATAGVIEACVRQTLLSGKIIRGCGLPGTAPESYDTHKSGGHHKTGCVKAHNGEICYCDKDFCNSVNRVERLWTVFLVLSSFLLHLCRSCFL
ncbi:hypothetical protein RvY_13664 [Ramazzottius varieornatus]|uniref:Uncharacterized protein n=1 Tax=Ramazzottius varieornatus TaxID=947166 RepID=A0A1D1VNQ9_RAMVA|nr:hypothetical protein RvY_13664 [Ramazzottius varieornatus]